MKWLVAFLLISLFTFGLAANEYFQILTQFDQGDQLHFSLPDYQVVDKGEFDEIQITDAATSVVEGKPSLPQFTVLYQIDPYLNYEINHTVLNSHTLEDVKPYPAQSMADDDREFKYDASFYASTNSFPEVQVSVSERQNMRGLELIAIQVTPFRYTAGSNSIEVWEEVEISVTPTGQRDTSEYTPRPRSRTFEELYSGMILNYDSQSRTEDYQTPAVLYICSGNSETNPYMQSLFDWRHERGYVVYHVSTAVTGSSASQIKSYITNAYNNYDPPPEIVCLVGDSGGSYSIPHYTEYWSGYNGEGDHPYSQLDGGDILPEVLIGRLSINSSTVLNNVVNKTIKYEKAAYTADGWHERAALVGDPGSSGISTIITNEYIADIMDEYGMDDIRERYSSPFDSWMRNQLSEGILFFNYRGYLGVSGFNASDIDAVNNGYKTPFATFITCGTGSYASDTALSESFLREGTVAVPQGAVGAVGTATWGTHTVYNNIVDMGFYDGIFVQNVQTAGGALASGKLALYNTYPEDPDDKVSIFTYWNNLMGDPALHLFTDTPQEINVTFDTTVGQGTNFSSFLVTSLLSTPIVDAMVTLVSANDEIFISGYTDANGEVTLSLNTNYNGNVTVTVTGRNLKPVQSTLSIVDNGPQVNLEGLPTIDDASGGNGNGLVNPGETIDLTISVENYGSEEALGVSGELTSQNSLATVTQSSAVYGDIAPGATASGDFEIQIADSAVEFDEVVLQLDLSDSVSRVTWSGQITLAVSGPLVYIDSIQWDAGPYLTPGASDDLSITLINDGTVSASGLSASITSQTALVTVDATNLTWTDIGPSISVLSSNSVLVEADGDIINGSVVNLEVHITSPSGYDQLLILPISIGQTLVTDPLGPDQHGYYIYDSGDSDYNLAPVYNWIEIDPDLGGPGTSLAMYDNGNGNPASQQSAHVALPFTFTFYGQDYNEITVSTNGWIALGDSDMESFRNYHVPGPGGPSPMIAAFWDDLTTDNGGQVYRYINSGDGYVIVEWSQMRSYDENDVETFQIILYDAFTPTGDDEILIQYKVFNNTTNGNLGSGGINHGKYSTIGIENHLSNIGLEYTFDNDYPTAAMPLGDETALFITTRLPEVLPVPALTYNPGQFDFEIEPDNSTSGTLAITNSGEAESVLYYSVGTSAFQTPAGTSDSYGHIWTDSDLDDTVNYEWIDISGPGTQIDFINNDHTAISVPIGFDFTFYGETYTDCIVSANGWIGFGEDNSEWDNMGIPSPDAPRPAILPFFDDLNPVNSDGSPSMAGEAYYHSDGDRLVIWFDHVAHWEGQVSGNYDFQAVLYSTGEIKFNYNELTGTYNRCTVGIQNGTGTDGIQVAFDSDYLHDDLTIHFKQDATWLDYTTPSGGSDGAVPEGSTENVVVSVDATGLALGEYNAFLSLTTNVQPRIVMPVTLLVSEDLPEMPGDLNGDLILNVLDIVTLVGIIVDDIEPTDYQLWAGELSGDGIINVIDIVILVGMIIEA